MKTKIIYLLLPSLIILPLVLISLLLFKIYLEQNTTQNISSFPPGTTISDFTFPQSKVPICPSDFPETDAGDEARMNALDRWTNEFFDTHPYASLGDWAEARHQFWVDNNCEKELQGYEEIQAGGGDQKKLKVIKKVISENFTNQ